MSKMLASVANLKEALFIQQMGVDIIDLKQPAHGALGALSVSDVRQIIKKLEGKTPLSATIGDLPLNPEIIYSAVKTMAETGVDYVKIGLFADISPVETLEKLSSLTTDYKLIAVLFADAEPDFSLISLLKKVGFVGVMLDTQHKQCGSLLDILSIAQLKNFVELAHAQQLICGLAGSLRLANIATLLPLKADYLGFRGALCEQQQRTAKLDAAAIQAVQTALN